MAETKKKVTKKKSAKKANNVRTEEITENLKCMLTEDEVKACGDNLAKAIQEKTGLEADKKSVVADFKAKIEAAESTIINQSNKVRDKYEYRNVTCNKIFDFKTLTIRVVRTDTNEEIENRAMTLGEKNSRDLFS